MAAPGGTPVPGVLPTLEKRLALQGRPGALVLTGDRVTCSHPPLAGGPGGSTPLVSLSSALGEHSCFRHKRTVPMFVPESASWLQRFTR